MYKLLTLLFTIWACVLFASPNDTITYRQRRAARIEKGLLDISSGAQRVISVDHSHTHNYESFSISYVDTLADDETKMFVAFVNNGYELHFKNYAIWAEKSPLLFIFIDNPDTIRMSTDTIIARNRNRSNNLDDILFPSNTTVTDSVDTLEGGTILKIGFVGGGSGIGSTSFSGNATNDLEWIFGEGQYVIFKITNQSGAASAVSAEFFWYETKE